MQKKISGCIVTYNNSEIIKECVSSILEATKNIDFQLYIVDNGSADNTVEIITREFEEVKIIDTKANLGFGHGHNKVLPLINSDYHVVINPDIIMEEDAIGKLTEYLDSNQDVLMATPKVVNEDKSEQYLPKYCPTIKYVIISKFKPFKYLRKRYTRQEENLVEPTEVEFCTGCFFVIRTKVFKELKGFDERFFMYCEDADLSRRIRQKGKIIFYPYTWVIHKWNRDNTRSFRGIMRFMNSLMKYFIKWGIKF